MLDSILNRQLRGACLAAAIAAALLLVACTDSHGGMSTGPSTSTETGNPPAIDQSRVALVVSSDEVHVVGEPDAVTPGGGEIEVETLASGDVARGPVDSDGSFDIAVDGSPYDTYLLRAIGQDGESASAPLYLHRGGATSGRSTAARSRAGSARSSSSSSSTRSPRAPSAAATRTTIAERGPISTAARTGIAAVPSSRTMVRPRSQLQ